MRRLGRAALLSLGVHLVAGAALAFVLWRGLGTNPDLSDRVRFVDEQRWLWRAGWACWNAAALSVLYFFWSFAAAHRGRAGLGRAALTVACAAVAADLTAEAILMWRLPGLAAAELLLWDRRAVLLTGFLANGLYTGATGMLAWSARAHYPAWLSGAAALVVAAGAGLSWAAWLGSIPGMFWANAALVPAIVAWQAGVGWKALRG